MAWYYGVNNSELYGSNFSTVLADAPPPLDDTYDEDDNEIVFRNEAKKSKKYNGENAAASIKKSNSSDEKFIDKSKRDGDLSNGENQAGGQGNLEEDSDFGDFAGFADFGSAFEQEKSGESQNWFANSTNSVKAANSQPGDDDEFADFAAFEHNDASQNRESIPNGGYKQGSSTANDFSNLDKNELGNKNLPSNGSYDVESDDEFGDFASTEVSTEKSGQSMSENVSNRNEIQKDCESSSISQGRTCTENHVKSDRVSVIGETNSVQCNGDFADKKAVSHSQESRVNHTLEISRNVDEESGVSQKEISLSKQEEKLFNAVVKNEELTQLENLSVADKHEDYHPIDSSVAASESQEGQIRNTEEYERTNTDSSSRKEKELSEYTLKSDEKNTTNTNMSDSSKGEHCSDAEIPPGNDDPDDDGFGEFADFSGFAIKPPSFDDDDDDEEEGYINEGKSGISNPVSDPEDGDSLHMKAASVQDKNIDDDDFGDFGSFDEKCNQSNKGRTDFAAVDSKAKYSTNDNDVGEVNDDLEKFRSSDSEGRTLPSDNEDNNDFGDFGVFDSSANDSQKDTNNDNDFGEFGTSNYSEGKTSHSEDEVRDNFGDSGNFDSNAKELQKDEDGNDDFGDFGTSSSEGKTLPAKVQDDDFGNFGTFKSGAKDSKNDNDNNDDFGDFGNFASNTSKNCPKPENNDDFGSFESNTKDSQNDNANDNSFGDFGAFDAHAKDLLEKNESVSEFGDFGGFESKVTDTPKGDEKNLKKSKDNTEDFRTSDWKQNSQMEKNEKNSNKNDDFGDFSSEIEDKAGSFASFSASKTSTSESTRKNVVLKEKGTRSLYFVPDDNVIIKQVGDPVALCFTSELRYISHIQCDLLSTRVKKSLQREFGLWHQLEHTDKEGRIPFHWSNSFSQHKKFLSLMIRPGRPPPVQGGSLLKPTVSSQFPPFGGGLAGSMLMPEPPSKVPNVSSGLDFLEPVKGSHVRVHNTAQDKTAVQHSVHPEIGLPDLSFVLGNGLKRTASKSDIKDNVSDTASESSSLDLDFFAPTTTQPSDGKSEPRALYEADLLGLDIFSSSVDAQKLDSPKPQKSTDTKKVWQHGGVTIPLSSQENRVQLSAAAKSALDDLEDLSFMRSSVLMFPLKSE